MKAGEANLLTFLNGRNQFVIPIYQRTYSWTTKQCEQLWKDICTAAANDSVSGHFVGSVVYIARGLYHQSSPPQLLVIDGQQRLTTVSLLLAALAKVMAERNEEDVSITPRKIKNLYLLNSDEEDDLRYKVLLTQSDRDTFISLIDETEAPQHASTRILENYRFFLDQVRRYPGRLDDLFQGINKLIVVDVSLDREHDNPQLIFESLNSTGLDLSQADLIRNYVLMGLDSKEQADLYKNYWFPMEQSFSDADSGGQFDRFMRDYLTVKTGRIPNIGDVYTSFKAYITSEKTGTFQDIIADVYQYSKYFVALVNGKEQNPAVAQVLSDINALRVNVAYPFLLEVYNDYHHGVVSKEDFVHILKLVESYVFRRSICGIPTNSLNKTFATLYASVKKDRYLESIQAAFLLMEPYKRFPNDEEFWADFALRDIYNLGSRNYVLRKMENFGRKETVNVETFTIEHILPQNPVLSLQWQNDLGANWKEIQAKYLHTIGNLTLTGYNPELSDKSFIEKRDMPGGFADSPIRLNHLLATLAAWDEAAINKRAEELADLAVRIWSAPALHDSQLAAYQRAERQETEGGYTLADHAEYLNGPILALFQQLRTRVLNLDASVREEVLKLYIAYKTDTNFVDVVPQKSRLRLSLNMRFDEIDDPKGLCKDVTNLGRWGNGDVEVSLRSPAELDDVMTLIRQAYQKHSADDDS